MKRLRLQLVRIVPAVAALFALSIAAPQAGLYYHEHAGGTRAHVHADDDGIIAELLGESVAHDHGTAHHHPHDVPHHYHAAASRADARAGAAAFEHDEGPVTGHWHEQQRFHRAVVAAAPRLIVVAPVTGAAHVAPALSRRVAALDLHARAPPRSPLA